MESHCTKRHFSPPLVLDPGRLPSLVLGIAVASLVVAGCSGPDSAEGTASISITNPEAGATVTESRFKVLGRASGVETIRVEGESTEVVGGEWSRLLSFEEGSVTVTAEGGGARATRSFTIDSHAPDLTLDAPERASYVEGDGDPTITVRGRAEDTGTGLRLVSLQGEAIEVDDDGRFETEIPAEVGLNVVRVKAVDEAGNTSDALRGVVGGPTVDPESRVEPGFRIDVSPEAVETAATVVEQFLTPERITEFARESLTYDNFELQRVDFEAFDLDVSLEPGHIAVEIAVENLELEGDAIIDGETYPVVVLVDRTSWSGELHLVVDDSNELSFEIEAAELQLEAEHFHFELRDPDGNREEVDNDALRRLAVDVIRRAFTKAIEGRAFDELWDPAVLKRRIEVADRRFVFELVPLEIRTRTRGLFFRAAVRITGERHADLPEVPGALERGLGTWNESPLESHAAVRTDRTAIERIAHGVWRSGLFHRTLGQDQLAAYDLPVDLNADALAFAVDRRITSLADGDTPAVLHLRPSLPPFVEFESGEDDSELARMRMGEFMVDLRLEPPDADPIEIASVAVFFDLGVDAALDGFRVDLSFTVDVEADLHSEPKIDFDDGELENTIAGIVKAVPKLYGDELTIEGEDELRWIELQNPSFQIEGDERDRVKLEIDLAPNPEGLDP